MSIYKEFPLSISLTIDRKLPANLMQNIQFFFFQLPILCSVELWTEFDWSRFDWDNWMGAAISSRVEAFHMQIEATIEHKKQIIRQWLKESLIWFIVYWEFFLYFHPQKGLRSFSGCFSLRESEKKNFFLVSRFTPFLSNG